MQDAIDLLKSDRRSGATQLARRAASVLKIYALTSQARTPEEYIEGLRTTGRLIADAKPMAAIANASACIVYCVCKTSGTVEELKDATKNEADRFIVTSKEAVKKIATIGAKMIGGKILTHSWSSTVAEVFKEAVKIGREFEVFVTYGEPGGYGKRVAARLGKVGVPVTMLPDTGVGAVIRQIDRVLVGADSIFADGSVMNASGTYPMALVAKDADVPFNVATEILKIDVRETKHELCETVEKKGKRHLIPYFDVTPANFIDAMITDKGTVRPKDVKKWAEELKEYWKVF